MFGQNELQTLLAFDGGEDQVISLYLNADTTHESRETIKLRLRSLLKDIEDDCPSNVERIERYFEHAHDWSKPGVALFCCTAHNFFQAYPAAVAFRNRVRVGRKPYVKPLAHLLDYYAHYGVVLIDRIGARFYEFHLGELQNTDGYLGEDVRKLKHGSGSTAQGMRGGTGGARHEEEAALRNLREAATAAGHFFHNRHIRRLFLGGTAETVGQFRELLPKQLQSCLAGTFAIDMEANESEVRDRSLALLAEANAEREKRLVESLITTAAKGGLATIGLDDTLRAVSEGRVQTLVISDGFRRPGYLHDGSGYLMAQRDGYEFPLDGEVREVEDVIESAVARAMEQGSYVEVITEHRPLEDAGRIGALLRY